jgi:hypothetical protein
LSEYRSTGGLVLQVAGVELRAGSTAHVLAFPGHTIGHEQFYLDEKRLKLDSENDDDQTFVGPGNKTRADKNDRSFGKKGKAQRHGQSGDKKDMKTDKSHSMFDENESMVPVRAETVTALEDCTVFSLNIMMLDSRRTEVASR